MSERQGQDLAQCALPGGRRYTPAKNSVLVIAAGAPWVWDAPPLRCGDASEARWCVDALRENGYDVTVVWEAEYDKYPKGWRDGRPDLKTNGGRNHMTLADDFVVPKLRELVAQGRGPAIILCGSRGGQCTLPRLWDLGWRGSAVCVNAGCTVLGKMPINCQLSLVTGGLDFFKQSARPDGLAQKMRRHDVTCPILLYHDPAMGHTGAPEDFEHHGHHMLSTPVLFKVIELTSCGSRMWRSYSKGVQLEVPLPEGTSSEPYLTVI